MPFKIVERDQVPFRANYYEVPENEFPEKNTHVDYHGRWCIPFSKSRQDYSNCERVARAIAGVCVIIITLGIALFYRNVYKYFTKKSTTLTLAYPCQDPTKPVEINNLPPNVKKANSLLSQSEEIPLEQWVEPSNEDEQPIATESGDILTQLTPLEVVEKFEEEVPSIKDDQQTPQILEEHPIILENNKPLVDFKEVLGQLRQGNYDNLTLEILHRTQEHFFVTDQATLLELVDLNDMPNELFDQLFPVEERMSIDLLPIKSKNIDKLFPQKNHLNYTHFKNPEKNQASYLYQQQILLRHFPIEKLDIENMSEISLVSYFLTTRDQDEYVKKLAEHPEVFRKISFFESIFKVINPEAPSQSLLLRSALGSLRSFQYLMSFEQYKSYGKAVLLSMEGHYQYLTLGWDENSLENILEFLKRTASGFEKAGLKPHELIQTLESAILSANEGDKKEAFKKFKDFIVPPAKRNLKMDYRSLL